MAADLKIALDPTRSVEHTLGSAARADARTLTPAEVFFALGRVALELGQRTFSFFDYVRVRDDLIRKDRRRNGTESILEQLMPTALQLTTHYGDWNQALAAGELEPFIQQVKRGMSIVDAYDLLIALTGRAPGRLSFDELRTRHGISIERFPVGRPWPKIENELRAGRKARGLDTPSVPLREQDWATITIPAAALDGAPRKTGRDHWTYERCVVALADYLSLPRVSPSQADYQSKRKQHGWPPVSAIQRQAPWSAMLNAARKLLQTGEMVPLERH